MTLAGRRAITLLQEVGILLGNDLHDKPVTSQAANDMLWGLIEDAFTPKPALTEEGLLRYQHADLRTMDMQKLWKETKRAEALVVWCEDKTGWIAERYEACLSETERRDDVAQKSAKHG